jgi:G3E family GTPase
MTLSQTAAAHSTHEDEGYVAKALTFEAPVSIADLEALLHDAGPGLCRAKGIIEIEGEGICVVQYAAGQLEISPAPDETPLDLVLIGTGLTI